MATTTAIGPGPIAYTSTSDGSQVIIPLTDITFSGSIVQASGYSGDAVTWLQYLASQGILKAGATSPPQPAMVIQAADPGAAGNNIQIDIPKVDVSANTFDAAIAEIDTYDGLSWDDKSPQYINKVLGTTTQPGTRPGLVHVKDGSPAASAPNATTNPIQVTGGDPATRASCRVPGASGDAFVLEAKKVGDAGADFTVTIANVDTKAKTFLLTATWKATGTGINPGTDLPGKLPGSGWEITVSAPSGGTYALPSKGTINLVGGADIATAGATLLTQGS